MSRTAVRFAALFGTVARLSLPFALASAGAMAEGCLFTSPGPSNVAQGKQYISGEPSYDGFFAELYQVQLAMGQAPDKDKAARERIAGALGLGAQATTDELAAALEKRTKSGAPVEFKVSGLDDATATPTATVSGAPTDPKDKALVSALEQSAHDEAALLDEARKAHPVLEKLRAQSGALETGIDSTFRKGGPRKKSEVSKNVDDAKRLIPLITVRVDETEKSAKELLQKLAKAAPKKVAPPPPPPEPAPVDAGKGGKKKKGAGGGGAASTKPAEGKPSSKPADAAPAEPKPAPKAAPPASEDFEP